MKIKHKSNYAERRTREYPSITDQIEIIIKTFAAWDKQIALPPETKALVAKIDAIKTKYPKP